MNGCFTSSQGGEHFLCRGGGLARHFCGCCYIQHSVRPIHFSAICNTIDNLFLRPKKNHRHGTKKISQMYVKNFVSRQTSKTCQRLSKNVKDICEKAKLMLVIFVLFLFFLGSMLEGGGLLILLHRTICL